MASVYDRTDIYDLLEDETRYDAYKKHWENVLDKKKIETFDCVASTGNSLPHVNNTDVLKTLEQMNKLVSPGGYLTFPFQKSFCLTN